MIPELDFFVGSAQYPEFMQTYMDYANRVSPMTPALFHESAALWLLSLVASRRVVLHMAFADVYPNLFLLWIANTTIFNKTTALNIARRIASKNFQHLLSAQEMTPESFYSDFSGKEPSNMSRMTEPEILLWKKERDFCAQKGLLLDEMSSMMNGSVKDYNAGLIEALLRFYDCDPMFTRSTRGQGKVMVKNSYLTMIGASTPSALSAHLNNDFLWSLGWWPRFALLCPDKEVEWKLPVYGDIPDSIESKLQSIYERLPKQKWPDTAKPLDVTFDDEVFKFWDKYNKNVRYDMIVGGQIDEKLFGTYGRSQIQALKVAMLLALLDWDDKAIVITMENMINAINIVEEWRKSAHRVIVETDEDAYNKMEEFIIEMCKKHSDGVTLRDIYKAMHRKVDEVEGTVRHMVEMQIIEGGEVRPVGAGRPTVKYKLR